MSQAASEVSASSAALKVTLLAGGWTSSAGGLPTFNRELAIQLSQHPKVEVSFLVPDGHCTDEEKSEAQRYGITVVGAKKCPGSKPLDWLSAPPKDHKMDVVIGHGAKLGWQVPFIRNSDRYHNCKWLQVVHTAPEDLSKYKDYSNPTSKGEEKHEVEVELCNLADLVVPVGPILEEHYSAYLQGSKRDIFPIIPGLFDREFGNLEQSPNENAEFRVLLCGRGDDEDFELKGYDTAAKAFTDHRLQGKSYHLIFVGSPEGKQEEVKQRLLEWGIGKDHLTVRKFVQSREKMRDLLCEVNLVIMPSRSEAFGLVALEALSAGLPILVSNKSGFASALQNIPLGKSCIVDSHEPAKWAEAIEGVRVRHGVRLEEIKILRTSYDKKYSWKEQCEALVENMRRIVYGSSTGSMNIPSADPRFQAAPGKSLSEQQPSSDEEKKGSGASPEDEPSGEQSLQKERKQKTSGTRFDLDRLIRLIISSQHLDDEVEEEMYEILSHNGQRYVNRRKLSGDVLEKGVEFFEYLTETLKVNMVYVAKSSLEIVMLCPTLESLKTLWSDYLSGHLNIVAEKLLVTDEIKRKLNLETVRLTTTIEKENYLLCKKVLMEIAGAAYSTHLPSEETKPDQGEDARGTGTSSDDQQGNNTSWMSRGEKAKASRSALHWASINGQYQAVKILLEYGADVDKRDEFYLTPLHLACWYGQESVARLLLEHGADANALDRFHRTPLQKAERNNHQSIVQLLLENSASPSFHQPLTLKTLARNAFLRVDGLSGFNLLQAAVSEGDYDTVSKASVLLDDFVKRMKTVKTIFKANVSTGKSAADILSRFERRERNRAKIDKLHREIVEIEQSLKELHHHAKTDDPEKVVELVLNDGVDVNIPAENNLTPLMCASQSSSCELFKSLIDLGADINSYKTDDGVTPFLLAASWNHYVAIHLLLEHDADANIQDCAKARRALLQSVSKNRGNTALHKSALGGFFNISRLLIKSGCNINQRNAHGETPLHMAVKTNSEAVVKLLLENNVHVNIQDFKGSTALHTSVRGGVFNISQLLIESGCNINKQNSLDETPLHIAVKTNSEPVVKMLLENNADVNIQDFVGNTALHCSARTGVLSILQLLMKSGCNINQLNFLWETPLHIAVKSNSEPVVKLLLENQANVNFRHHLGNAALYESIRRGFLNISRLLIDSGANINKQNDNGKPPLHTAGSSTGSVKIPRTEAPVLELSAAAATDRGLSEQQPSSDGEKKGPGASEEDEPSGEQSLQKERRRKTSGSTFDLGSFTIVVAISRAESSIQQQSFEATLHKGLSGQQSSCGEEKEATRTSEDEEPSVVVAEVLKVTFLADGWTSSAGLPAVIRELAIHLSQHPKVEVSLLVPDGHCTDEEKREALSYGITVVSAKKCPSYDEPLDWLGTPPEGHKMDVVVGHGANLGRQVQFIKDSARFHNCQWVQVVHSAPEDLSKYKGYSDRTSKGEKKREVEVELCKLADLIVPVGPRLEEVYSSYLQRYNGDTCIFPLIPGLFDREFGGLEQSAIENAEFKVLLCGRGDEEDFELEGYNLAATAFTDHRLQSKRYSLLFVGAPEGKQEVVRERLLQCGIAEEQLTVKTFVQSREKMKDLLCEVNLAIMPSKSEGFGLAALEALSAGLPVLVNSKSGFARALEELPCSDLFIVNSDEPAKWVEAIEGVRISYRKRLKEITLLRTCYDEQYSWKEQCGKFVEKLWTMVYGTGAVVEFESSGEQSPKKERKRKIFGSTLDQVKDGAPSVEELETLSPKLKGDEWKKLGRVLKFGNADLTAIDRQNPENSEKAYHMLLEWKQKHGSSATYQVLYTALCNELVERRDLAKKICCFEKIN